MSAQVLTDLHPLGVRLSLEGCQFFQCGEAGFTLRWLMLPLSLIYGLADAVCN